MLTRRALLVMCAPGLATPIASRAQTTLDHVDPARVERTLPKPASPVPPPATGTIVAPRAVIARTNGVITVGAVTLSGLRALRPSDFVDIFEAYVGRTLSPAALEGLADAVSERARSHGYLFATTTIPPQRLGAGVLRLVVDEGRVDEVRLVGVDNKAARAVLAPLANGAPVTKQELQRRLLIVSDIDGVVLKQSRLQREGARTVLLVEASEKRVGGVVGADNYGTRPIGPVRIDATVIVNRLIADDDSVTFTVATNPLMPGELAYSRVRYAREIDAAGTEIFVTTSYATVKPGSYLADRDIVGRSWTAQIGASQPLLRRRKASLWLQASFDVRSVKQNWAGELARRDRLTSVRAGVYGYTTVLGGVLRGSAAVSRGVLLFGATRADDPLASRPDADGTYTSVAITSDWTGPLGGPLSAQFAISGQIAGDPLLISEEFGLGGGTYLRPYDYNERSGDDGVVGSVELRYSLAKRVGPLREPLLYVYGAAGDVGNLRGGIGGGALYATGGGVRTGIGANTSADAGVAVPLAGARYDSGNSDPVFNFRVARSF